MSELVLDLTLRIISMSPLGITTLLNSHQMISSVVLDRSLLSHIFHRMMNSTSLETEQTGLRTLKGSDPSFLWSQPQPHVKESMGPHTLFLGPVSVPRTADSLSKWPKSASEGLSPKSPPKTILHHWSTYM